MIMTILMVTQPSNVPFARAEEPVKMSGMYLEGIGYREQEL
jgi:hypothetical protein